MHHPPHVHESALHRGDWVRKGLEAEAQEHRLLRGGALAHRLHEDLRRLLLGVAVVVFVRVLVKVDSVASRPSEKHGVGLETAEPETLNRKRLPGPMIGRHQNVRKPAHAARRESPLERLPRLADASRYAPISRQVPPLNLRDDAQTASLLELRRDAQQRVSPSHLRRLEREFVFRFRRLVLERPVDVRPSGKAQELRPPVARVFSLVREIEHRARRARSSRMPPRALPSPRARPPSRCTRRARREARRRRARSTSG